MRYASRHCSAARSLPDGFDQLVRDVAAAAPGSGPLDGLRTVLSAVAAAETFQPSYDLDGPALRRDALRLAAVTPTVVAALHRLAPGRSPVRSRQECSECRCREPSCTLPASRSN